MTKPSVTNGRLSNIVNNCFRGAPKGTTIGDGSAFAACSHEVKTGNKVGGRSHIQKIQEVQSGLKKLQSKHSNKDSPVSLSSGDLGVVTTLLKACTDALSGSYKG